MKKFITFFMAIAALGLAGCKTKAPTPTSEEEPPIVEPSESEPIETSESESSEPESSEPEPSEPEPSEPESSEPEPSEPEVVNDGTLEHPFTVSEGYAIAAELEANKDAGAQYFTIGKVTGEVSWYNGRVSFMFTDGEHTLKVYNMNNEENKASYKKDAIDFGDGDELIVAGTYKNYVKDDVSTLEICYVKDVANCYRAG